MCTVCAEVIPWAVGMLATILYPLRHRIINWWMGHRHAKGNV